MSMAKLGVCIEKGVVNNFHVVFKIHGVINVNIFHFIFVVYTITKDFY